VACKNHAYRPTELSSCYQIVSDAGDFKVLMRLKFIFDYGGDLGFRETLGGHCN
jgi:hypothetical protein